MAKSYAAKGKKTPPVSQATPSVVPPTPSTVVPPKPSATPVIDTTMPVDVEDDDDNVPLSKVLAKRAETSSGKKESTVDMAEAQAKDAIAKGGSSKPSSSEATKKSAFERLIKEDRTRSYKVLNVMMAEIFPEDDPEFKAIRDFAEVAQGFIQDQLNVRQVCLLIPIKPPSSKPEKILKLFSSLVLLE